MITLRSTLLLPVLCFITANACFSQDTTLQQPTRLELTDGSELIGTVIEEDSVSLVFTTLGNIPMTIPKNQVKTREVLSGQTAGGEYVRTDPNYTRLLFAPTARPLKSGQGYFSVYQIFFPFVAVGIADFLTVGGGMSLFPGLENQIFYLAPKVTPLKIQNFSAAGGLLYVNSTAGGEDGIGIYYTVATYGTQKAAGTLGFGWGFHGRETADKPVVMLGGELQVSRSMKFITENWIPPESRVTFLTLAIRFFGENLAADLGFIYPAGSKITGFPFIPWVGFAYNFGV